LTAAIGFEVHHYHLHLIPAWSMADLDFKKAQKRSEAEMKDIQQKLIAALQ
jgi:histidine triad (HIT) family protein